MSPLAASFPSGIAQSEQGRAASTGVVVVVIRWSVGETARLTPCATVATGRFAISYPQSSHMPGKRAAATTTNSHLGGSKVTTFHALHETKQIGNRLRHVPACVYQHRLRNGNGGQRSLSRISGAPLAKG